MLSRMPTLRLMPLGPADWLVRVGACLTIGAAALVSCENLACQSLIIHAYHIIDIHDLLTAEVILGHSSSTMILKWTELHFLCCRALQDQAGHPFTLLYCIIV